MATNHTTNYNLNLWEPTDSFIREEFNQDNEKIDAAIAALTQTVSGHTSTLKSKGNCQITANLYDGDGRFGETDRKYISFSKTPFIMFIAGAKGSYAIFTPQMTVGHSVSNTGACTELPLTWERDGVSFYSKTSAAAQMNSAGEEYRVIIFTALY